MSETTVKKEGGSGGGRKNNRPRYNNKTHTSNFKAPTAGFEDVVFHYPVAKGAFKFTTYQEQLTEHVSTNFKYAAGVASQAMRDGITPRLPRQSNARDEIRRHQKRQILSHALPREIREELKGQEQLGGEEHKNFQPLHSHCSQEMKTKLQGLNNWPNIPRNQDGVALVSALQGIYHRRDEADSGMLDLVKMTKAFFLTWQKEQATMSGYLADHKAV